MVTRSTGSVSIRKGNLIEAEAPAIELTAWSMGAYDMGHVMGAMIVSHSNVTSDLCTIQFQLNNDPLGIGQDLPWSTPDQTSPHSAQKFITEPTHRGLTYDVLWRYLIDEGPASELAVIGSIIIPEVGWPPQMALPVN